MSYKSFLWLIPFALTMWGCTESGETGNCQKIRKSLRRSVIPPPEIQLLPGDLFSNISESALEIDVNTRGWGLDASQLKAVQDAIRFTDAQSSPVHFTTSIRQSEWYGEGNYTIQVIPNEPLKEGWHTLGLANIPEGFAIPWVYVISDDGSLLYCPDNEPPSIRFRTDSWPMVHNVIVCFDEKKPKVSISFSEPVKMNETLEKLAGLTPSQPDNPCESLTFLGDRILCTRVDGSEEVLDMSNRKKMADALEKLVKVTSSERDMVCQSTLRLMPDNMVSGEVLGDYEFVELDLICTPAPASSSTNTITVELASGLVSLEGVELKGPLVHQFVVGELSPHSGECRYYRAPIVE
ncbi:MAG: hypothetical protein FWC40_04905 [Proteobacteria bacterium]|nr:hypothetical protein [Pseudomonadota bacterium]